MKKDGMTLVELIAVIAILGILTMMVSPAIIGIRNVVLQNTHDSKVAMIHTGAIEYAMDHINEIPSKVDFVTSNDNKEENVPCICDCTAKEIKGIYSVGGKTCQSLCENYDPKKDKSTDGSYKITQRSYYVTEQNGLGACVAQNQYCLLITVNDLIIKGYLVGDKNNKEILEDPLSEEPFNLKTVCIRYNNNDAFNRKLIAYIIGEKE